MEGIGITKMSSRGQVVIPLNMRSDFEEGESLVIMKNDSQIILKKASDFSENIKEDLEFARRTEEAYKEIEEGKSIRVNLEDLDKVMDSW